MRGCRVEVADICCASPQAFQRSVRLAATLPCRRGLPHQRTLAAMLPLLLAAVLASLACCSSPCHGRYGEWVSEPGVFTREDQPKHLQGLHVACVWRDASGEPLRLEALAGSRCLSEGQSPRVLEHEYRGGGQRPLSIVCQLRRSTPAGNTRRCHCGALGEAESGREITATPPGELRSCPSVAEKLPNRCRNVRPALDRLRPEVHFADAGRIWQLSAKCVRSQP